MVMDDKVFGASPMHTHTQQKVCANESVLFEAKQRKRDRVWQKIWGVCFFA